MTADSGIHRQIQPEERETYWSDDSDVHVRDTALPSKRANVFPGKKQADASISFNLTGRELQGSSIREGRISFHALKQADGTYSLTLTEAGIRNFETALAIADDLGSGTRISDRSTIRDIMERTALREDLSDTLRDGKGDTASRLQAVLLRRRLRGSESPSAYQQAHRSSSCSRCRDVLYE